MKSDEGGKVEFAPPKGFAPPDPSETGEFDLVCTFRANSDGQICLVQLGDTKMPGYDTKETDDKNESKPDYGEYAQQMQTTAAGGSTDATGGMT